jgi:hypothetical protein
LVDFSAWNEEIRDWLASKEELTFRQPDLGNSRQKR